MNDTYIILGSTSLGTVQAFGPFRSERQAQLLCDRANRELVGVSWLVMKVDSRSIIDDRISAKRAMKASA